MDKGYYNNIATKGVANSTQVAIHNKNGQGLLLTVYTNKERGGHRVAIHNKNGQGLLLNMPELSGNRYQQSRNPQ